MHCTNETEQNAQQKLYLSQKRGAAAFATVITFCRVSVAGLNLAATYYIVNEICHKGFDLGEENRSNILLQNILGWWAVFGNAGVMILTRFKKAYDGLRPEPLQHHDTDVLHLPPANELKECYEMALTVNPCNVPIDSPCRLIMSPHSTNKFLFGRYAEKTVYIDIPHAPLNPNHIAALIAQPNSQLYIQEHAYDEIILSPHAEGGTHVLCSTDNLRFCRFGQAGQIPMIFDVDTTEPIIAVPPKYFLQDISYLRLLAHTGCRTLGWPYDHPAPSISPVYNPWQQRYQGWPKLFLNFFVSACYGGSQAFGINALLKAFLSSTALSSGGTWALTSALTLGVFCTFYFFSLKPMNSALTQFIGWITTPETSSANLHPSTLLFWQVLFGVLGLSAQGVFGVTGLVDRFHVKEGSPGWWSIAIPTFLFYLVFNGFTRSHAQLQKAGVLNGPPGTPKAALTTDTQRRIYQFFKYSCAVPDVISTGFSYMAGFMVVLNRIPSINHLTSWQYGLFFTSILLLCLPATHAYAKFSVEPGLDNVKKLASNWPQERAEIIKILGICQTAPSDPRTPLMQNSGGDEHKITAQEI